MSDDAYHFLILVRIVNVMAAVAMMAWGAVIDLDRGQHVPGKGLFLAAGVLLVLDILSFLVF